MRPSFSIPLLCGLLLSLVACGGREERDTAPQVVSMTIAFEDITTARSSSKPDITLLRTFLVELARPEESRDISRLRITDPTGLYVEYDAKQLEERQILESGRFRMQTFDDGTPDSAPLGTYTVTVSQEGKEDSTYTMVAFAQNDRSQDSGRIYSLNVPETPKAFNVSNPDAVKDAAARTITYTAADLSTFVDTVLVSRYRADGSLIDTKTLTDSFTSADRRSFRHVESLSEAEVSSIQKVVIRFMGTMSASRSQVMVYTYSHRVAFE